MSTNDSAAIEIAAGQMSAEEVARIKKTVDELTVCQERVMRHATGLLRNLTQGEASVLLYLDTHKRDTTPVHIAERVSLTCPRITQIVDSLEAKGFVRRERDKNDGRKVHIVITDRGRKAVDARRESVKTQMTRYVVKLGINDAEELLRLLNKTIEIIDTHEDEETLKFFGGL